MDKSDKSKDNSPAPASVDANVRIVLAGTYKGDQLVRWRGWYNWPISDKDEISEANASHINELWLFQGTKVLKVYKAKFVGIKTREELIRDYGYPAIGKAHGEKYLLFKTELQYSNELAEQGEIYRVIVRTKDFATSPKVRRELKAFLESSDRSNLELAKLLPDIIAQIPSERLCVGENAVQMTFWDIPASNFAVKTARGIVAKRTHGDAKPFVKWAGGKSQLLEQLDAMLPSDFSTRTDLVYVEPFVGGGAMLFHVLSKYPNIKLAVINDLNADLMTCYRIIKERPEELITILRKFNAQYKEQISDEKRKAMFFTERDRYNSGLADEVETAALFIFLNRTCFNGLYRVNSKGQYNVPFGKAVNPIICDEATIWADSDVLKNVEILCGDFEKVAEKIPQTAFFYFDPPYRPLTQTAAFTAYSKYGFGDEQQIRLAQFARRLTAEGNQWLLSNSDPHNVDESDDFFDKLFSGFDIRRVFASRMINSKAEGRGKITELAIRNYED